MHPIVKGQLFILAKFIWIVFVQYGLHEYLSSTFVSTLRNNVSTAANIRVCEIQV